MEIGRWWVRLLPGLAALALGGCVINPYVSHKVPAELKDPYSSLPKATEYAVHARNRMAGKAQDYAFMNNGGGALLLNVAGLAAYRGFRGDHEANVAALTMGGAALYGTQQYLYRKPREAIYWAGAGALTCAIDIAAKSNVAALEVPTLRASLATANEAHAKLADKSTNLHLALTSARQGCATDKEWAALDATAMLLLDRASKEARTLRAQRIESRLRRLELSGRLAGVVLVGATDSIVDAVNSQLVAEQPDPATLARLVSSLKMPALEVAAPPPAVTPPPAPSPAAAFNALAERLKSLASSVDLTAGCQLQGVQAAYRALDMAYSPVEEAYSSLEKQLEYVEAAVFPPVGAAPKQCAITRSQALLPFDIALAQEGAQALGQGSELLVPIVGGVAPFKAPPAALPVKGSLSARAETADDGSYRFRITASQDATPGTYALIASDAAGVARPFQVRIEAAK
jgi:hypothetical protein